MTAGQSSNAGLLHLQGTVLSNENASPNYSTKNLAWDDATSTLFFVGTDKTIKRHYWWNFVPNATLANGIANDLELTGQPDAIKIYPNPASKFLNIEIPDFNELNIYSLEIYDYNGARVYYTKLNTAQSKIVTEKLNSGLYAVKIFSNNVLLHTAKIELIR